MKKIELNSSELHLLNNGLAKYKSGLIQKMKELNECSSHFFVNEGLMNEVRIEKEKIQKEMDSLEELMTKIEAVKDHE